MAGRSEEAEEAELSREGEPGASGSSQQARQEAPCLQEQEMSSVHFVWFISDCDFLSCVLSHLKVEAKSTRRGRGHQRRMPSSGEAFLWTNTSYSPRDTQMLASPRALPPVSPGHTRRCFWLWA